MVKRRIEEIAGMGDMIIRLSNLGMIPKDIIPQLKEQFSLSDIPSQATIYNFLKRASKKKTKTTHLTGDARRDAQMVLNALNGLMESVFAKYGIKYQDKKKVSIEIEMFRELLSGFVDEACSKQQKLNDMIAYWHHYMVDYVFLPVLDEVDKEVGKRLTQRLVDACKDSEERIEEVIKKYGRK